MNTVNVPIQTATITTSNNITSFDIQVMELVLGTSARLIIRLLDTTGKLVDIKHVNLAGTDYSNWGADDNYIKTFVASQLGYTII